jgi:glycosyltransferase involved in cell wall biosynthesis
MQDKIIVFVPGYNVSKTIKRAISNLLQLRKKLLFDILYVDNDSSDNSAEIVENFVQENKIKFVTITKNIRNLGYGGSQKVGFYYGFMNNYDYLIEYDSDLQYPYQEIYNLYREIKSGKYSIVFGSRITKAQDMEQMPKWKAFGNRATSALNKWALNLKVSEIHTGFRMYDLKKISNAKLENCHNDYRWTLDIVIEILKVNNNFGEIPVKALYHKEASSPSYIQLFKTITYMVYRALEHKLTKA